jgi:hypothetical protein
VALLAAILGLDGCGPPSQRGPEVTVWTGKLSDPSLPVRREAAWALAGIGDTKSAEGTEAIRRALADGDREVRLAALWAAGRQWTEAARILPAVLRAWRRKERPEPEGTEIAIWK